MKKRLSERDQDRLALLLHANRTADVIGAIADEFEHRALIAEAHFPEHAKEWRFAKRLLMLATELEVTQV